MWFWLLPAALAGPLVDEMDAIVLARQPAAALACGSTGAMTSLIGRMMAFSPVADRLQGLGALTSTLAPAAMAAVGIPEQGVWSLALLPGEMSVDIPFTGSKAQATLLLTGMTGIGGVRPTKDGWSMSSSALSGVARLGDGTLELDVELGQLSLPGGPARPTLLRDLPEVDGCLLYASFGGGSSKVPVDAGVLLIPTEGDVLDLRVHTTVSPPDSLSHGPGRAPEIATRSAPDLVVSTGVDLLQLVAEINQITSMGLTPEQVADLNKANRRVSIAPGSTIGVFMADKRVAGRVPLKGRLGFKLSKRKIKRGINAMDEDVKWMDGGRFILNQKGDEFHGVVHRGLVLASNDPKLLDELESGEGTPWLSDEGAALRDRYPIVIEARGMDLLKLKPGQVMRVGLGATEDTIGMQVQVPEGYGRALAGGGLGVPMPDGLKGPKDLKRGVRALQPKMELEENINGIYIAELAYEAAYDMFLAAEPAPRRVEQLSAQPLDWVGNESFNTLGWRPDGPVRGTWWVEVTPDGESFTVYGAVDEDGDGVPARARRVMDGAVERLTPPEIK